MFWPVQSPDLELGDIFQQLNCLKPLTESGTTLTRLPVKSCLQVREGYSQLLHLKYLYNSCSFPDQWFVIKLVKTIERPLNIFGTCFLFFLPEDCYNEFSTQQKLFLNIFPFQNCDSIVAQALRCNFCNGINKENPKCDKKVVKECSSGLDSCIKIKFHDPACELTIFIFSPAKTYIVPYSR